MRDAAFSLKPTRTQSIYFADYDQGLAVGESTATGKAAQPTFDDAQGLLVRRRSRGRDEDPRNLGVRIRVKSMGSDSMTISGRQREVTRRRTAT